MIREFVAVTGLALMAIGLWGIYAPLCPLVIGALLTTAACVGHLRSAPPRALTPPADEAPMPIEAPAGNRIIEDSQRTF